MASDVSGASYSRGVTPVPHTNRTASVARSRVAAVPKKVEVGDAVTMTERANVAVGRPTAVSTPVSTGDAARWQHLVQRRRDDAAVSGFKINKLLATM